MEHRRIILSGPSGTGKTYLANRLSEYLVLREGRELTDGVIATFNVDHKSSKVRRALGGCCPAGAHLWALSPTLMAKQESAVKVRMGLAGSKASTQNFPRSFTCTSIQFVSCFPTMSCMFSANSSLSPLQLTKNLSRAW